MKKFAVGMVVQNRLDLTLKTLQSLYYTDQPKNSYDFYIIDNGSDKTISDEIAEWCRSALIPVKNLIRINKVSIGIAWNLFFAITKDYFYRTKIDNDLVFANTPIAKEPYKRPTQSETHRPTPGDHGTNPGAIPGNIVIGRRTIKDTNDSFRHTCFLQHMEEQIANSNLGICALLPVSVGSTMQNTMPILGNKQWRGNPVLFGSCMTIIKDTFEKLGYFDETLPIHVDWEYSQRALAEGINIGYTANYCVIHLGEKTPTLSDQEIEENEVISKNLGKELSLHRDFVHSKWEKVLPKIEKSMSKTMIVNVL